MVTKVSQVLEHLGVLGIRMGMADAKGEAFRLKHRLMGVSVPGMEA